jgi:hypothetical protein
MPAALMRPGELEEQCRRQALLSATPETRVVLEKIAFDYRAMADWLLEIQAPSPSRTSD